MEKTWKRHLVVGFFVFLIFFGWFLRGFLWMNWRFKLFSTYSWKYILHEFESGWMLDSLSDWIFLFTLCSALPCFLYLWYLCAKVRWRALFKKILKKITGFFTWLFSFGKTNTKTKNQVTTVTNSVAVTATEKNVQVRPRAMSVQNKNVLNLKQYPETQTTTFQMSPTYTSQSNLYSKGANNTGLEDFGMSIPDVDMDNESYANNMEFAQTPLDEVRLPERQAVIEDLDAIWHERKYLVLEKVPLPSGVLDYVAVNKETIYACILDREPSDWLADEESFNGEDPLWFSEVDHRTSPVFVLKKMTSELKKKLNELGTDFSIKPLLIEQKGNIINAEDMMKSWLEMGVSVCRTDKGGPDDLPTFGDFLKTGEDVAEDVFEQIKSVLVGGNNNG